MKTKTIGKLIIILIVVILMLGGVFAYLYFGTDLLKSNEQLFFKYLGQLVDSENGFIDSKLTEYTNKKMTGKYEDSGQFSVNIDVTDVNEDMLATVNDFNVTYSGKVDNTARKNEQEISRSDRPASGREQKKIWIEPDQRSRTGNFLAAVYGWF